MDDITAKTKLRSAEEEILALAREHGVTYQPTELDELADTFARLSDNDVELDEPALLLIALERAGHITSTEAARKCIRGRAKTVSLRHPTLGYQREAATIFLPTLKTSRPQPITRSSLGMIIFTWLGTPAR